MFLSFLKYFYGFLIVFDKFVSIISDFRTMRQKNVIEVTSKSVLTPSAQIASLCESRNILSTVTKKALSLSNMSSDAPVPLKVLISMQLKFGLRISELLLMRHEQILTAGRVLIRSSKGSQDRIICYDDEYGYLSLCKRVGKNPFEDYNRFFIYRFYKKNGIELFHEEGRKSSVTHALRHAVVKEVMAELDDINLAANYIGHKSTRSTEYYTD